MKKDLKIFLTGIVAISMLDTLGSIASRLMNFNYADLWVLSLIIYLIITIFIAKYTGLKTTIFYGAVLGLFDVTIGWKISILLQANTGNVHIEVTPIVFILTAIFMLLFGGFWGFIGWLLSTKIFRLNKSNKAGF